MSTTFYIRYYDTQHDEQQPEGSRNQTKAAQRADLLHNNRSAANSLAQTIDAASSSTEEAQIESGPFPPPWWDYRAGTCAAPNPTKFFARSAGRGSLRHTPPPRCSVGVCTPWPRARRLARSPRAVVEIRGGFSVISAAKLAAWSSGGMSRMVCRF